VLTSTSRPPSPLRGVVMNLKNMTMVLIITLVYEVILKSAHTLTPSFFDIRQVTGVVTGLRYVTGVIVVVFIYLFYRAEGQPRLVGQGLRLLLLCVAVSLVLRLPVIDRGMSRLSVRVASQTIGLAISALLFVVIVAYRRSVAAAHLPLRRAASAVAVVFAIGIGASLAELVEIVRFAVSEQATGHSRAFFNLMFVWFLVTHASVIYFLFMYRQSKRGACRGQVL
jgi:hypothetical protein